MSIVVSAKDRRCASRAAIEPAPQSQRLSDLLAERIWVQIDDGTLRRGEKLPSEQQLAAMHGVSRTVVREAVHQLKSQGLVRSRQGLGVFVTAKPADHTLVFDPKQLGSIDAVLQIVELRRVIEGEMAALAARRATARQVRQIERALAAIDTATDRGELGVDEDLAFHRAVGEATGNPQFVHLLRILEAHLRDAMSVTKSYEALRDEFMASVRGEHQRIATAIAAGNEGAARRAAIEHHARGEERLVLSGVVGRRRRRQRNARGAGHRNARSRPAIA